MATDVGSDNEKEDGQAKAFLSALSSPEPDMQRGRRRVRSPLPFSLIESTRHLQLPSGESSTFRGRCRHRSTSLGSHVTSRNNSRKVRKRSYSPSRQRLLPLLRPERKRRSQSPSRSRSAHHNALDTVPNRRRQRTRSRSRSHRHERSLEILELMPPQLQTEVTSVVEQEPKGDEGHG